MMDSKPNGGATDAADRGFGFTALEGETRSGGGGRQPGGKKKFNWKAVIGVAVAIVIVWQLFHVLTEPSKPASSTHSAASGPASPSVPPTPTPTVTLGGHPVAAGAGPAIVLNPGLVAPGGYVEVEGSGFDPGAMVTVYLEQGGKSTKSTKTATKSTAVAHGKAAKWGVLSVGFHMPATVNTSQATVVAQEAGGKKTATASLAAPGGVGTASIIGKAAGKPGSVVTVNATGFGPGEQVNVYWGRTSGTPAATLTADAAGDIRAPIKVGIAPVGPTTLVLVGQRTKTTATAPYLMLGLYPETVPHPYAERAGHAMTFTGTGFAPNEKVLVYLNANRGVPALTPTASGQGSFSVSFVVPFGLKGKQQLTAIGDESRATATTGFTVEPYMPSAQASTYGALPGTTVSFYGKGFAANEVVLVYANTVHGRQLVTAFRVNQQGSAAGAGSYVIPSGVGPQLIFTLIGQKSGGTANVKFAVQNPGGAAPSVAPQPPYVLPPSLGGKPSPAPTHSSAKPGGAH
ncbi:MAG TPA: hypothetical protein VMA73_26995 [Streptosporangiaceae bacterium]|nr:hypothetical protein [Streptosporangiaceae bacterium]